MRKCLRQLRSHYCNAGEFEVKPRSIAAMVPMLTLLPNIATTTTTHIARRLDSGLLLPSFTTSVWRNGLLPIAMRTRYAAGCSHRRSGGQKTHEIQLGICLAERRNWLNAAICTRRKRSGILPAILRRRSIHFAAFESSWSAWWSAACVSGWWFAAWCCIMPLVVRLAVA